MTEQSAAITISHPPPALMRILNRVLRVMLATPLAGSARKRMMVVTFKGRKTGRQYSIPLSAHRVDNHLYALTNAPWKNNFRDGIPAEVLIDGKRRQMRGELITDPAFVGEFSHRCAETYGVKRAELMMGLGFRDDRIPALEDFVEIAQRERIAAVKLTPTA
jgi:hypothetical protein